MQRYWNLCVPCTAMVTNRACIYVGLYAPCMYDRLRYPHTHTHMHEMALAAYELKHAQ